MLTSQKCFLWSFCKFTSPLFPTTASCSTYRCNLSVFSTLRCKLLSLGTLSLFSLLYIEPGTYQVLMNEQIKCPSEYRLLEAKRKRHCPYPFRPNPHVLYQTTLSETKWGTENEMPSRLYFLLLAFFSIKVIQKSFSLLLFSDFVLKFKSNTNNYLSGLMIIN